MAAIGLAALVNAFALAVLVVGIAIAIFSWPYPIAMVCGLVLASTFVLLMPRFPKFPEEILSRSEAPALHALIDRIANAVGAKPIQTIGLSSSFKTTLGATGLSQRRVLTLGIPLVFSLAPQELVALIAHQIGHDKEEDPLRGFFVRSALATLEQCHSALTTSPHREALAGHRPELFHYMTITGFITRHITTRMAVIPRLCSITLLHLLWHSSQRAEYRADAIATRIAGKDALKSLVIARSDSFLSRTTIS